MEVEAVYVTRDTYSDCIKVRPETVGIRKFHGCIEYGSAFEKGYATIYLYPRKEGLAKILSKPECKERFGFYPGKGTAWYVNTRGKRTKVDIDFSD